MNHRCDLASCSLTFIVLSLVWLGVGGQRMAAGQDRPSGPLHKTRSAVMAREGMAATSQPLATITAIKVLQKGGNAVDAAIAANAVLGVVEPMSCGLGGDLFAIVWDSKTKKLVGLNASGRSPAAATIELFKSKGLTRSPPLDRSPGRCRGASTAGISFASGSAHSPGPSCSNRRSRMPGTGFR